MPELILVQICRDASQRALELREKEVESCGFAGALEDFSGCAVWAAEDVEG